MQKPGKDIKVLILDHEKIFSGKISQALMSQGHLVALACEPASASRKLAETAFHAVIVNLKGFSAQAGKEIEALKTGSGPVFIYLTDTGKYGELPAYYDEKVREYSLKISEPQDLFILVEKISEKISPENGAQVSVPLESFENLQKEKLSSLGQVVSGISHEINNPLTAVIGYTQLLLETKGVDFERYLGIINEQAKRCSRIVQDMQIFSRKRKAFPAMVDPCEIMEDALEKLRPELQKRSVGIVKKYPASFPQIFCDPSQMRRVFENIISNAAHALEEVKDERQLKIEITQAGGRTVFVFTDTGPGIPPGIIHKIFDPFFTTKEVGKGTGLGLSVSYGIVQAHKGEVSVKNNNGRGAVFTVELPNGTPKAPLVTHAQGNGAGVKINEILLVEDNEAVASYLKNILGDKGYTITLVQDGKAAYEELARRAFDLTLCDYRIPKMNGWELFEKIRAEKPAAARNFIFISGSLSFAHEEEERFKENRLKYLAKPFTAEQLFSAIRDLSGS